MVTSRREPAVLIAPLVTFVAVALMLVAARFYHQLPLKPGDCGFLATTGVPCPTCGGTRSMMALSQGKVAEAFFFHPAFAFMVLLVPFWLLVGIGRFRSRAAMPTVAVQNRRLKIGVLIVSVLLLLNWIYLIYRLP